MSVNGSPRRCNCDECRDTYSILQELDLFAPAGKAIAAEKKRAITAMAH
ncbi:hypothetical protein NTE_02092 [Candidatus Nitrososphaera evergladensis SR1]|uniref:Uncharacterized protein n=1 Tax=Candidatus Nitrososphaera evergladensis SR1 TaxID=1459636 RepID=A0A075MSL6_9ARCH|nr:hypothetical protein [Candidatus Nitrososphaera evergladensis]AIF84148.1 hypothetical protein NTE_02092 [Candidatus Nitrososphaera evergladensis SR1]